MFAAQLEEDILFDLALVIDSAISFHNPGTTKFIDHAALLSSRAGLTLTKADLRAINADFRSDFDGTLQALLDSNYDCNGKPVNRLSIAIAVCYGIRNRHAHEVRASHVIGPRLPDVRNAMFAGLFLAVETLY
jgi:hypothetical protein